MFFLLLEILFIAKSWICFFIIGDYCYCKVWDMVEERALQLAPPPGHSLTSILCSLSFEMFCFVFTHFLPLFMPGRTHQSKNTASQTQPQALHHPTTSPPSSHQDLSKSRSLWTPLHLPTLLLLLRQLFISLSSPCSECFWPWLNCRRGCSWPSHATPAEPGCPQPGGYHKI